MSDVLAQPWDGPRPRIAVAPVIDRSAPERDYGRRVSLLLDADMRDRAAIASGIRDLLAAALFRTDRFILLERERLDEVLDERAVLALEQGDAAELPADGSLEGVEFLVVGALTGFDSESSGGIAFPIPFRLNDRGDVGVLDIEMRSAFVAVDLRLVEVASGRVVAAVAAEGRARKFGAGLSGIINPGRHDSVRLPVVMSAWQNTPVEQAVAEVIDRAAASLTVRATGMPLPVPAREPTLLEQPEY